MKKLYSIPQIHIIDVTAEGMFASSDKIQFSSETKASRDAEVLSNKRGIWDED